MRNDLLKIALKTSLIGLITWAALQILAAEGQPAVEKVSFEQLIRQSVVPREMLNEWLRVPSWVTFHPELGYILGDSLMPWGTDNSATIETIQQDRARTTIMYADKKLRINTYGDSFTESQQVNNRETWQEYLAGHLGEPVANFGVGGYGVYHACRRMVREEKTDHHAKCLILSICCDDSTRSLYRYRRATFFKIWKEYGGMTFHANFRSNRKWTSKPDAWWRRNSCFLRNRLSTT